MADTPNEQHTDSPLTPEDLKGVENFKARQALKAAARPYVDRAAWVDGDPLMEVIASTVWEHCTRDDEDQPQAVCDDPRTIAAFAGAVASAHMAAVLTVPSARRAAALDEVANFLRGLRAAGTKATVLDIETELRELAAAVRSSAEKEAPTPAPGTCGHHSAEGHLCTQPAGHHGYHRNVRQDGDEWTSWVGEVPGIDGTIEAQPTPRRCAHTDISCGRCVRPIPHDGECFHERQPIRIDEETDENSLCNADYPGDQSFVGQLCALPKDHFGDHRCDEPIGAGHTALLRWKNEEH